MTRFQTLHRAIITVLLALLAGGALAVPKLLPLPHALDRLTYADTLEHAACLLGHRLGAWYIVTGLAQPDTVRGATRTRIIAQGCPQGALGMIHTHPDGIGCYYYFPTTQVMASDAASALLQAYDIDAIYCRGVLVWFDISTKREHRDRP